MDPADFTELVTAAAQRGDTERVRQLTERYTAAANPAKQTEDQAPPAPLTYEQQREAENRALLKQMQAQTQGQWTSTNLSGELVD